MALKDVTGTSHEVPNYRSVIIGIQCISDFSSAANGSA